jgi:hypothetical protein
MFSAWSDSARGGFDDCGFLRELVTGSELLSAGTRQFFRKVDAILSFRRFSGGKKF